MTLLFVLIYAYRFYLLNDRIVNGNKVNKLSDIFLITNGLVEEKLNGHIISTSIKDSYLLIIAFVIDILMVVFLL